METEGMTIIFGPAGHGGIKGTEEAFRHYHENGLKICEVPFTYGVYVKREEDARMIGEMARKFEISLSVHAPYWVNLNSPEKEKVAASKTRILESCKMGELMGAKCVVFHPGYYMKDDRAEVYERIKERIIEMLEVLKKNKWKIELAPETMGKINVFGSVEEISRLVSDTGCGFCIDFAHILARDKEVDYKKIERLFPQKEWHCHFSGIVYGEKGERKHKSTEREDWKGLLKNLPRDRKIRIVNESPTLVEDSIEGLGIWKEREVGSFKYDTEGKLLWQMKKNQLRLM